MKTGQKRNCFIFFLLFLFSSIYSNTLNAQASLPITRTSWGTTPTGWTESMGTYYSSTFACSGSNGGKFDASAQYSTVNFNSSPNQLSFVVKSTASTTSSLLVEESSNGSSWTTVISLSGATDLPTSCTTKGTYSLSSSSRYVRWTFTKGSANLTIDDVSITAASSSPTISKTGTLSALSTTYGTASSTSSFTVSGSSLTNDILITPPAGFEVSKTSNSTGFASTQTLTQSSGTVNSTTIYIRLAAATAFGSYSGDVALTSSGATTVNIATASSSVAKKALTITGLSGTSKTYDRTTSVVMTGTATYSGLVNSESFSVSDAVSWAFPSATVGSNKTLTQTGSFTVPSSNYSITQPSITASITSVVLTVSSASANNKVYNGTTAATISGSLNGIISPDVVTLSGTGTFASANVGTGISVTSTSTLGGANAANYSLTQPTGITANISQATQTITFGALANKTTGDAAFTLTGSASSGLTVTYSSSNPLVATVSGTTVTIVGAGTTTITASQSGSTNYSAASNVAQSFIVTQGSAPTDYYRSLNTTGNWNSASAWQSSADNSSWITATLVPTSAANLITIQTGHTITINADATASTLLINGTLSFDGNSSRNFDVTGDISISSTGTFNAPNSAGYAYLTTTGNIVNNNLLDFYTNGSCDVTFNKNGNQTISGTGGTTKFNIMTVDMGTSSDNILEIMPTNFSTNTEFLHYSANSANELINGTIKFSGTYTYSNQIFYTGKSHEILSTCGFWLNNPNVTITASGDSWDVSGYLRITQGTMNIGTLSGNSLRAKGNSAIIIIEGGSLNVAGRICPTNAGGNSYTYTQSGGTVVLNTIGSNSGTLAAFDMSYTLCTFVMSGGSIIIRNKTSNSKDYYNIAGTYNVTGGTIQFGDASSSNNQIFTISSLTDLPNVTVSNATSQTTKPTLKLASNINIKGNLTIMSGTTLDASYNSGTTSYDIALTGTWSNSGTFTNRSKSVTFSGSTNQSISGSATTSFYNLTNTNSSSGLTLNRGIVVTNNLTMSGATADIFLNGYTIDLSSTGTIVGESNTDRIYGSTGLITTTLAINNPNAYNVGGMGVMLTSSANFGTTTVSRGHAVQNVNGDQSIERYFIITPTNNSGLAATLLFNYFDYELNGLGASESSFKLFRSTDAGSTWVVKSSNENTSANTNSFSNIDAFSWWTIAVDAAIPLPVELVKFEAKSKENHVLVNWETASEINSDYFIIERSFDGVHFSPIARVNGAGNSTHLIHYLIEDQYYINGINYYRLTQVDFNGDESISKIVAVDMTKRMEAVIKVINTLGQEVNENYSGIVFDVYSDGTSIRRIQ